MIVAVGIAPETQRAMAQRPLGIDVSHYDGSINWGGVQTSGVSFAWAKATENTNFIDYTFTTNETSAVAAGVLIGAYHFARYNQNTGKAGADAEANYFWATAQNYVKRGGYYLMPMLDVEITPTNYTKTTLSQWVNEWCAKVVSLARANNVLVTPVIYSSSSFANTWFDSTVTQWIPWIANWNGQDPQIGAPSGTGPWPTWIVWQYTDSASVPGVGTADGDVFNGLASDLVTTLAIGGNGPLITNQPVSQAVLPGANVSFNVGASAPWPMSYQWRFNATNIAGATASSYAKNNVQLADGGSYSVVLSDLGGDTISSNAVLTLLGSPVITNQPQDQVAAVGQGAAFAVGVSSFAPVSYQWQFNGMPLQDATNASVVLAGIRSTNVGAYSVVVSNVAGVVVSSNAALVLVQAALPAMRAARFGRIVLISSRAVLGLATRTAYSATKAGLIGLARTWAQELGPDGITVNAVAPGPIAGTAMFHDVLPPGDPRIAALAQSIPVRRLGQPEDVARMVLFLADPASGFITGQTMFVCGGTSVGSLGL